MNAKLTSQQKKVLEILEHTDHSISAQEIYRQLRPHHRIGLATVYRALEALKLKGIVSGLTMPSGETVYQLAPSDRHHFNCLKCGRSFPLAVCPLTALQTTMQEAQGFRVFYHILEFFGLCADCQQTS